MEKYFIRFEGTGGTLAVERHLYGIIREGYDRCLVSDDGIGKIVEELRAEQDKFFKTHKGKEVEIYRSQTFSVGGNLTWIHVGYMTMTLEKVRREI